jgi:hypothetical protein
MKVLRLKTFLSLFILTLSILAFKKTSAQGNLQFNQVINYDLASVGVQNFTVPPGKVWKIESVLVGSTSGQPAVYLRNAAVQNIGLLTNTATTIYPIWLGSGFVGSFQNVTSYRNLISIIEFNVVP